MLAIKKANCELVEVGPRYALVGNSKSEV